ncbi:MAG: hypothetical protein QM759_13085 [Terricaulis sp.]
MTDTDLAARTRVAARIVGPYLMIMGAMLLMRAADMALMLPAFMQDGPLVLAAGAFTALAGLTLLALHHSFKTLAACTITIVGIVGTLKGAWLLIAPQLGAPLTAAVLRASPLLLVVAALMLLVGAWLSSVGWRRAA